MLEGKGDPDLVVVPIVKDHAFGNDMFTKIEFVMLKLKTMKLHTIKYPANVHKSVGWTYDITP